MSNKLLDFARKEPTGSRPKIGVVGDAMIDEYHEVAVKGVSPEFPIPVMLSDGKSVVRRPGGAANVAYQFADFEFNVGLFSLLDVDALSFLGGVGINVQNCCKISSPIPRKKRFYSGNFPLCRLDVEQPGYGLSLSSLESKRQDVIDLASSHKCDAVIFSDYDKGMLSSFSHALMSRFPLTIVDPKGGDVNRWRGCTLFKPNESEAMRISGKSNVKDAGRWLVSKLGCSVVVTQAEKGVSVFGANFEDFFVAPKRKVHDVESVIGAGDCFVAFLTMATCRGMELREAVEIAFDAGTLYVQNKHNEPLTKKSIISAFDPASAKLVDGSLKDFFSNRDYRLVFTNGCFDILHAGHLHSFRYAKSLGDKLVVAVNTDRSVAKLKPGRPVQRLEDRVAMLQACEHVDYVVVFDEDTPERAIREIMPDVVAKGEEYEETEIVGYGIVPEIARIPKMPGRSTTDIIKRLGA